MPSEIAQDAGFDPDELSNEFWDILRRSAGNKDTLRDLLTQLSQEQVFEFAQNFTEAATHLKDDPFLQYASPNTSEDGMDDIANWVVSRGKEAYRQVWEHPETVPKHIDVDAPDNLYYIAESVYYKRFGEMPDLY